MSGTGPAGQGPAMPRLVPGRGFRQLGWGFLLTMIDFRLQGFDLLPDVVGHLLILAGLGVMLGGSGHFRQAWGYNLVMCFLSLGKLWEAPAGSDGTSYGLLGPAGLLIGLAALVVVLTMAYHVFWGIADVAARGGHLALAVEAGIRWRQYLFVHLAGLLGIVAAYLPAAGPLLVIGLWLAYVAVAAGVFGFMGRCGDTIVQV